jgi:hypothetical protein
MAFLENHGQRPFTLADAGNLAPAGLFLGKGPNAVEVAESVTLPAIVTALLLQ